MRNLAVSKDMEADSMREISVLGSCFQVLAVGVGGERCALVKKTYAGLGKVFILSPEQV